ncbi:PBECR4 domain-containing protein [Lactobacillus crispatus]|uniref:PBECR4 domain-containing protein n=1 Tax=Lactobacillus crispatus TaxID=47770 RepID=UPI0001B2AAF5|nr:PBECR4 domain-containing protein [Lactobacillus crispatus]EEU29362.1 hypothetical protein HMPREF0507_00216 [Lactobacillus crispatus MV-1A-US]
MSYLNYVEPTSRVYIKNAKSYQLATPSEVDNINKYESIIKQAVAFYEDNLSNDKINYVYKEKNNIQILPVKYKKENFPHLTGINFDSSSAIEKFDYLKNGGNNKVIIIERGINTFKKLQVLHKIPDLIKAESTVLTQLQNVRQSKTIGFSKGIKDSDNKLLIALQNFQPEFYQPKSLLNIKDDNTYANIPENTVLGIFKEKDIENGIKIEPISLNKDSLNNITITTEMLIGMKKYADELGKKRIKERNISEKKKTLESSEEPSHAKKLTVKVDPKAQEIALRRMRDQGLER